MSEAVINSPVFTVSRPEAGEYAPYYERYISLVGGNDILNTLEEQRRQTLLLLCGRKESDGDFSYAPGKWTVKAITPAGEVGDAVTTEAGGKSTAVPLGTTPTLWYELTRQP